MTTWSEAGKGWIVERDNLTTHVDRLRKEGQTIVTLNGSFDLLHVGHLEIIYDAAQQGDHLIVALNTDASIKRYKGELRPINPLDDRLHMMAALRFVGSCTFFDEDTPCEILKIIQPDVHVNGIEYGNDCVEAQIVREYGGRLHLVKRVGDHSTSRLINYAANRPTL